LSKEDYKRMTRKVRLTVYELELLVGVVSDSKTWHFNHGHKERVEDLQYLQDKLKESIVKEKP